MTELIVFPEVADDEVHWKNELLGRNREIGLTLGTSIAQLQFTPDVASTSSKWLQIAVGEQNWFISFSDWDHLPFVESVLGNGQILQLPDVIFMGVLESVLEQPLEKVAELVGSKCTIVEVVSDQGDNSDLCKVGFQLRFDEQSSVFGNISGNQTAMLSLTQIVEKTGPTQNINIGALPLVSGIEIGNTQIGIDELSSLKVHDVLLIENSTFDQDGSAVVRFPPNHSLKVKVEENSIIVEELQTETSLADEVPHASVNVVFEMGQVSLTHNQLMSLDPGAPISQKTGELVTLSSCGKRFAQGELVHLGRRIGVRVLTISQAFEETLIVVEEEVAPALESEESAEEPESIPQIEREV